LTTASIKRELAFPQSREEVWEALTDPAAVAEWMFPNDFEARVGHRFTFQCPPNPKVGFDGLVRCEVLECQPPSRLVFTWGGGIDSRVSYRLESEGGGTRVYFEQDGFDLSQPFGEAAYKGAQWGWEKMHAKLSTILKGNPG
jgi:uncharacterized protein YndB with AHSA1/START domain